MSGFVKTTEPLPRISGPQKAAILLAELGENATKQVYSMLALTPEEVKKLKYATESLGKYNPDNDKMVAREINVLIEALETFGVNTTEIVDSVLYEEATGISRQEISKIKAEPVQVANILKSWLSE